MGFGLNNADVCSGFLASFLMIILTEIGDKTFFMTAIFVRKYAKGAVIVGSSLALVLMTLLSTFFGLIIYNYLPRIYMLYASTVMFIGFSVTLLKEYIRSGENELSDVNDLEKGAANVNVESSMYQDGILKSFSAVFVAEWGDRSQLSTISLASTYNFYGVLLGASSGHILCTFLAAGLGGIISQRIATKKIELMACILFALFAVANVVEIVIKAK